MTDNQYILRERCRKILAYYYPNADFISIDKCCNEWIQKGHMIPVGIVQYFKYYFLNG